MSNYLSAFLLRFYWDCHRRGWRGELL